MKLLDELLHDEEVKQEYCKTVLLVLFKKIASRAESDSKYNQRIRSLYRESNDSILTTKMIIKKDLSIEINDNESKIVLDWINAFFRKKNTRKVIDNSTKEELLRKQGGKCALCGKKFENNNLSVHVDHIIPFKLVGDELDDNYQCLCESCNKCKSSRIDYVIIKMLNLK